MTKSQKPVASSSVSTRQSGPSVEDAIGERLSPTDQNAAAQPSPSEYPNSAAMQEGGSFHQQSDADLHSALIASELEQTLFGLVSSTDLFDVPAMDLGHVDSNDGDAI